MQSSKGIWTVKVRKTGRRVGTLTMAVGAGRSSIKLQRCGPFDLGKAMRGEFQDPRIDAVVVDLDHEKGIAWVDRADSLFGMPGYVMD